MRKIEERYRDELVVIGIHSAKFNTEAETQSIRQAVLRHNISHPVVNDAGFQAWRNYGVNAWPTLVLISPEGRILDMHAGEITFESYDRMLAPYISDFDRRGLIDRRPLALRPEGEAQPESGLFFPARVLVAATGSRELMFIADTGHHRVVAATLETSPEEPEFPVAKIAAVIGSGAPGLRDGEATGAQFNEPRGLALAGNSLFVADTENHAIRAIDLDSYKVATIAGTGTQAAHGRGGGPAADTPLSSPWDLLFFEERLYIAMAGTHQIWVLDINAKHISVYAGSGAEALVDGPLERAAFNQPSGLATDGRSLFVADSEASAIRTVSLDSGGAVGTIVGTGLFDFGDVDGAGQEVLLQHPLAVAFQAGEPERGKLFVADSYNNKIKLVDPEARTSVTYAGTSDRGSDDGPRAASSFNQPAGLSVSGSRLLVADTDNHLIRLVDLIKGTVSTIRVEGARPQPAAGGEAATAEANGQPVQAASAGTGPITIPPGASVERLPAQSVGSGPGEIVLQIETAPGLELNPDEKFYARWSADHSTVIVFEPGSREPVNTSQAELPLTIRTDFSPGEGLLTLDLTLFYCKTGEHQCMIDTPIIQVPIQVDPGTEQKVIQIVHKIK